MTTRSETVRGVGDLVTAMLKKQPKAKGNHDPLLNVAFIWFTIMKEAEAHYEDYLDQLKTAVTEPDEDGDYDLLDGATLKLTLKKTKPRKSIDTDKLAETFAKKLKQPIPVIKDVIEQHKLPKGKGVNTWRIVEKG